MNLKCLTITQKEFQTDVMNECKQFVLHMNVLSAKYICYCKNDKSGQHLSFFKSYFDKYQYYRFVHLYFLYCFWTIVPFNILDG